MHTTTPTVSPTAPAASNTRRTAADVKADRSTPARPGLDTGEDRRTPTTAGTTPTTGQDHVHNAAMRAYRRCVISPQADRCLFASCSGGLMNAKICRHGGSRAGRGPRAVAATDRSSAGPQRVCISHEASVPYQRR
jgi:hypothetical protein